MPKTSHELAIEFAVEITEVCLALPLRLLSQNLPQKSNFGKNGEEKMNENENSRLSRAPRVECVVCLTKK